MTRLLDGEGTCGREIEGDVNRRSCGAESADSVLPRGTGIACGASMWAGDASCFSLAAVDEELKGAGLGLSEEGRFYLREFARQNRRLLR